MQPYQEASQETQRQSETPLNFLKNAIPLGVSTTLTGVALNKVVPFLSKYVPEELAKKGLSKLDPRFGKFIDKALGNGNSFDEVREFIKEKTETEPENNLTKENRNIIEQYSPELHQFINEQIKNGRKVIEAGTIAQNDKRFSNVINKISKDHKTDWSNILQSVYGQGEIQPQKSNENIQQSQQAGQGQAALMAILQKLQQSRGGQ